MPTTTEVSNIGPAPLNRLTTGTSLWQHGRRVLASRTFIVPAVLGAMVAAAVYASNHRNGSTRPGR